MLRHLKEGLTDTGGIEVIVFDYETTLNMCHLDWDGSDISPDPSDNDLHMQV